MNPNMKRIILLLAAALQTAFLSAQITNSTAGASQPVVKNEASNLAEAFGQGHFNGSFRTFFMATDNARQLSDYYAWAAGGSLRFNTLPWHGFSFGLGGMYNYNLASSDLSAKDSLTGASNRYEIGLFDVENPANRKNLDRTEELWLRYQHQHFQITLGQQPRQTPFVNYQDGRMRPTAVSGTWMEWAPSKNAKLEGGWLWKIAPRSTVQWYEIGPSIGLYPKGLNPDGTGSGYPEHLKSHGIGIAGFTRQWGQHTKLQVWDQYVENIFNTAFAQADHRLQLPNGHQWHFGLQMTHQDALAYGGNQEASKTYFQKGGQSNTFSAQTGWERGPWKVLAAYSRVTADGRFLSPREWGREPFYTFMSRERIEGSGDVHAATGRVAWAGSGKKLRLEAAYGRFYLPDIKNVALNKYAFPAYQQLNLDARYAFGGRLKGLSAQLLYVWKGRLGDVYGNDKYVINRVNMSNYSLVLNYAY